MLSKKIKNKNGITLVALVITIIILLILAGITISSLTNTGIFGRAKEAKEKTQAAEKNQQDTLAEYEKALNDVTAESLTSAMYNKKLSDDKNTTLKDAYGNTFVVPAGFKIVVSDDTNNATTVDKGIVIEDATDAATKGSQFVWVPVGTITKTDGTTVEIKLNRYTFADDDNGTPTAQNDSVVGTYYQELTTSDKGNTVAKSISNFKVSVTANGGYYIGRYEARKSSTNESVTEVRKNEIWNIITQKNAAIQSQDMYNSMTFTSDLINSFAWDTATLFLQNCGTNSRYSRQNSLNQEVSLMGTSEDKQCNIYDMASNLLEWTTETSNSSYGSGVIRGGTINDSKNCTNTRRSGTISSCANYIGFRPILYINV